MIQRHALLTEGYYYILISLYKPRHGYGIMQVTQKISGGRVRLTAGTLYGAIKILLKREWIQLYDTKGRKIEYIITPLGKQIIKNEINRLKELYDIGLIIQEE